MFSKFLSDNLLKIIGERDITQEKLAEKSNISPRYINSIICQNTAPTIKSLEKICSALDVTPNELLLPENHKTTIAQSVKKLRYDEIELRFLPVCPHCNKTIKLEYIAFCEHCTGKLSWNEYSHADII